jgi:CMP-N-acetylneuraminic acid synthetase
MGSQIAVLIPARSGSKRIPNKNIKLLGGKPLVVWSIETALALKLPCYVSTDSQVIAGISRDNGAQVIHRPSELASDTATDWYVIKHAYSELDADLLVYLRPTTPMRDPQVVWNAVRFMQLNHNYSLLRSVQEMDESPYKCVIDRDGVKSFYILWVDKPNHLCPRGLHPNGYVDICRGEWSYREPYWYETELVVELDTKNQWNYAEYLINNRGK